ncbi:hypothetical protein [Paraglaciecola chathamensis]|uniref:Uncharacterized protein n=1 Tax=Paraglaciecola chathamensis TaxID=368405 RepID=A0A8H9IE29_9ALTE|nr:hypothetical protein [Paraglaciecola oceanifecundans]GGZ83255.1 hypothetical protein GCM10011274_46110 [Paraglaciecola oceanifecundans]
MLIELVQSHKANSKNLTSWVDAVYRDVKDDPESLRRLYRFARALFKENAFEVLETLSPYAHFDDQHPDTKIVKAAAALLAQVDKMRGYPEFIDAVNRGELAGFLAGDLLYVVTPSVKPGTPKYQMTTFSRGIGPIGDALRNKAEEFISADFGLPSCARYISQEQLLAIEQQFLPKPA